MGALLAGWADACLHPETFWLGFATRPAAAWNHNSPGAPELMNTFCQLFYGPRVANMGRLYQLMSEQAQLLDLLREDLQRAEFNRYNL
jgi:hexosaminidase